MRDHLEHLHDAANVLEPLRREPIDKLIDAIGILQIHMLASESTADPESLWRGKYFKNNGIEHAINLLVELLEPVDEIGRTVKGGGDE